MTRGTVADRFLDAILSGDRAAAFSIARDVLHRRGIEPLYEEVVRAAMIRLGELWDSERISVADEHVATAVVQTSLAMLYPELSWPSGAPGRS